MAVTNGTLHRISVGGTDIDNLTTTSFSLSMDTRETTNKDSSGKREYQASFLNATIGFSGYEDATATYGAEELYDAMVARTQVAIIYTTGTTGATTYSASAFITSFDWEAPHEENVEFSGELLITGDITKGVQA